MALISSIVRSTTSSPITFQNSSSTEIGTLCRAWVNFDGTGSISIRANFNVSSITDVGTGQYTANITTALPNSNYVTFIGGFVETSGRTSQGVGSVRGTSGKSTTAIGFGTVDANDSAFADFQEIDLAIFS